MSEQPMRGPGSHDQQNEHLPEQERELLMQHTLSRVLHEQASQIHYTPEQQRKLLTLLEKRMEPLARRPPVRRLRPALIALACLLLVVVVATFWQPWAWFQSPRSAPITSYHISRTLATPDELAHSGQLASLDPTGRYLVYQQANKPGVMFTASLSDPARTNILAMRDAHDLSWAPDGSALVTTISAAGVSEPLLALVPRGQYMHLLGHDALAASWSPVAAQQITFVTETQGVMQVWNIASTGGQSAHLLFTLPFASSVQRLTWSPNGRFLLVVASDVGTNGGHQPARAIYVLDTLTHSLRSLVSLSGFTIGALSWSPDGRLLAYERLDATGNTTLVVVESVTSREIRTVSAHGAFSGWSWSPDSRALVYGEHGTLSIQVLHGAPMTLAKLQGTLQTPLWLPDGRILCLWQRQMGGIQQLAVLTSQ